jgi:hypothetical protein
MRTKIICCLLALFAAYTAPMARADVDHSAPGAPTAAERSLSHTTSQLWLVSTRTLAHKPQHSSRRLLPEVNRYEDGWHAAPYEQLARRNEATAITVVFVHGNDTDDDKCRARGLALYQALTAEAPGPLRLIVWSWPADYIPGTLRQDARVKAERAEADALYLARFLTDLECSRKEVVVGYSLGARVVGGALHLLGGGTLDGQSTDLGIDRERPPLESVLMAAAIDADWLQPGRRYGHALASVERMVVMVNPHDRVLRWYRRLTPAGGAAALGVQGLASPGSLGAERRKLVQLDVNGFVGSQHGWSSYATSPAVIERLQQEIFGHSPASFAITAGTR